MPAEQIEEITKRLYSDGLERLVERLEGPYLLDILYLHNISGYQWLRLSVLEFLEV